MLDRIHTLFWNDVESILYEENGYAFGVSFDLFNGHQTFFCRKNGYYYDLPDDMYKAIDEFNEIMENNKL